MHSVGWQGGRAEIPLDMLPPPRARLGRKRAAVRHIAPMDPLPKFDRRFLERLRRGPLLKRRLQQTLARDLQAGMFKYILNRLANEGYLFLRDGLYYLTRQGAAAIQCENVSIKRTSFAQGFVEFFGDGRDCFGMPARYRKYSIAAIQGRAAQSVIVTIMPLTRANPLLETNTFLVRNGGLKAAFLEAVRRLTALPQNEGLFRRILGR